MAFSSSDNPFADPSSTNPFEDSSTSLPSTIHPPASEYASSAALADREAALQRREEEIARREREVAGLVPNNWPPFYPVLHHDISTSIPEPSRALVTRLYQLWLALCATLVFNLISCVLLLVSGASDGGKDMIGSAVYVPFISVPAFVLWFRPIYYGFAKEHAFFFYVFYVFAGFHIAFSLYMCLGIPSTGSAGLINMVAMYANQHWAAAVLCTISSLGWLLQFFASLFFYRQIWAHGKAAGQTFEKAKGEVAAQGFWFYLTNMRKV